MAAINFPNSPSVNDIYLAENGVNYQWDGSKWSVYFYPGNNSAQWGRDTGNNTLSPVNDGDGVILKTSGGTDTLTLDAATGDVTSTGTVVADHFDIEALTDLP